MRLSGVIEGLVRRADFDVHWGSSYGLQERIKRGISHADHHLPGRLIMALKPEERELLRGATASDFQHRLWIFDQ